MSITTTIAAPDDWHVHLRDDEMLSAVARFTANRFGRALVMPNLQPAITTSAEARSYRDRILQAVRSPQADSPELQSPEVENPEAPATAAHSFRPLMALYLTTTLDPQDLVRGVQEGVILGAKYYPAGATTNSEQGGTSLLSFRSTLELMAEHGVPLFVHAEAVDPDLDIFDREAAFLERELLPVCDALPELQITVEHLSTQRGVELVETFSNTRGSITPHHLSCDRSDLLANGMRPHLYCKPVINSRSNRDALRAAATSGDPRFFLGTDSAPHPLATKEAEVVRAGLFNAPYALEVVAEVFHKEDALSRLESFVSLNGARHYGFEPNKQKLTLRRREDVELAPEPAATLKTDSGVEVRIFGVAEAKQWEIFEVS